MKALLSFFAAVTIVSFVGCDDSSSGSGTPAPAGSGGAGGSSSGPGGGSTGAGLGGFSFGGAPAETQCMRKAQSGTVTGSYKELDAEKQLPAGLAEGSCSAIRARDGAVIGFSGFYGAYEGKKRGDEQAPQVQFVVYAYSGDGMLDKSAAGAGAQALGSFRYRLSQGGGESSIPIARATVSEGGKRWELSDEAGDLAVVATCDAGDDTAPTAGPALPAAPSPGQAIVTWPFAPSGPDAALLIAGVTCGDRSFGKDVRVYADDKSGACTLRQLAIESLIGKDITAPGSYDAELGSRAWLMGEVLLSGPSATKLTIDSLSPIAGTYGPETNRKWAAQFACPASP